MNNKITILLADDHEIFRNGVEQLINNEKDMCVITTADNGAEAVEKGIKLQPDIILMDIAMPVMNGLDAARELIESGISSRILLFSLYDDNDYVIRSLRIGVMGYVLKDSPNKIFIKAIHRVASGQYFYSGDLTDILINELHTERTAVPSGNLDVNKRRLTNREVKILKLIAEGVNNKEIAQNSNVSLRTIEAHRLNIMRKLQVTQIEDAIKIAQEKKFI